MTSVLRVAIITVLTMVVAGLLLLAARVLMPAQMTDAVHLELKRAYLAKVAAEVDAEVRRPNLVVILFDDLGYGDLSSYGSRAIRTPNLDSLAADGLRFTQGYSPSAYCSASRAGLLTGRHPARMGLDHVLQPAGSWKDVLLRIGARNRLLPEEEIVLPEVLDAAGYSTALVGKWHLGDRAPSLPNTRGFQSFYGLVYSNDQGEPSIWRDQAIVESHPIDQSTLTQRYTEQAVAFLESQSADRPFFILISHNFPHVPLSASESFAGSSDGGLYGDVVEELDASVGNIVDILDRLELAEDTMILVTSDNGPWFQGSSGGLRGRKMDLFEGGMRVPFLISWPGTIEQNLTIDSLVSGLDLFPTFLELAEIPLPTDRKYDGVSLAELLRSGSGQPRDSIIYSQIEQFQAWRRGRYKYHAERMVPYGNPMDWRLGFAVRKGPWLFDLETDPSEAYDISTKSPEVAQQLATELSAFVKDWEQNPRGWLP